MNVPSGWAMLLRAPLCIVESTKHIGRTLVEVYPAQSRAAKTRQTFDTPLRVEPELPLMLKNQGQDRFGRMDPHMPAHLLCMCVCDHSLCEFFLYQIKTF